MEELELNGLEGFFLNNLKKLTVFESVDYTEVTDIFRKLRLYCTLGITHQTQISHHPLLEHALSFLFQVSEGKGHTADSSLCLRIGLQFLANWLVNNFANKMILWKNHKIFLKNCLKYDDYKIQCCTAMILYNIFLENSIEIKELVDFIEILIKLTQSAETSEFPIYLFECLIIKRDFLNEFYNTFETEQQLVILDMIAEVVREEKKLPISAVVCLTNNFKKKSDSILKTVANYVENMEPMEVSKILDILSSLSGNTGLYLKELQKDRALLINCVFLLKSLHDVGKCSANNFSSVQKLSELNNKETICEIEKHPGFSFKSCLIRIIGNLSCKHKGNQDLVREIDGIPLLLDCCNIDARNPLILQWSIFAIHNLCENNIGNQKVIASMTKEGIIDTTRIKELGITLNSDAESSIGIVPLR